MSQAKPFSISKKIVWAAYERVKANQGAAGVDSESIEVFENDLKNNLYKIWNRMSSGTYFPPPVRTVAIPKKDGGERRLGIPTVADRIAQTVAKLYLEPLVEPSFHPDSYGYRPRKSALDAVGSARQRCWRFAWVIDLDIRGFFDNLDHELVLRAVRKYTQCPWILLYLKRWLEAPAQLEDGTLVRRTKGTPQGGVVSPLVANIFLHLAFDDWMRRDMRRWQLPLRSDKAIDDLARMWNPVLRGWIQYYGRFYRSALCSVFRHLNDLLVRWAMRKYKRFRRHRRRAEHWLGGVARREARLFAHWQLLGLRPAVG